MNLFILDEDPWVSARLHCDKHVVKMILEGLQLEQAALYRVNPMNFAKKPGWTNCPGAIWAAETHSNYYWLCRHTVGLCNEYTWRYGRVHSKDALARFRLSLARDVTSDSTDHPTSGIRTPFYQGVPNDCKQDNAIEAYQLYYNRYKWAFAKWTNRDVPEWFNPIRELNRHE